MNYYELNITLSDNNEVNRDILAALLADTGFESFVESETGLIAYVPEKYYSAEAIDDVLGNFPRTDLSIEYTVGYIQSQDWNEEWEKNFFQPIIIGNQCVIHSSFHKNIPTLPFDIVIDPKMAFGTGHHETTSLMVEHLLSSDIQGKSFLDMGCGTAVLAILAKMKGSGRTLAIDNDEWAYRNSLENTNLNQTEGIEVLLGDAGLLGEEKFDVIFANINRNILLQDIHRYVSCLNKGGELYLSGFYTEDLEVISKECYRNLLQFVNSKVRNNWIAAKFIRL